MRFPAGATGIFLTLMLSQDLATFYQEVKSILLPSNWSRTLRLPQQKRTGGKSCCVTSKMGPKCQYGLCRALSCDEHPWKPANMLWGSLVYTERLLVGVVAHCPSWGPSNSHHQSADMWVSKSSDPSSKPSPLCPVWICDPETQWAWLFYIHLCRM